MTVITKEVVLEEDVGGEKGKEREKGGGGGSGEEGEIG